MNIFDSTKHELLYDNLQPHQKRFWDVVETLLKMGVTPTPKPVNQALGKEISTSWNGPLCRIRTQLLEKYGYELVEHKRLRGGVWRWEKKK